ncbi:hypothetical protein N8865_00325, partial [Francisellaceae bacterium]|nr:hypothetical protein [Francisellaceae bacterium]
VVIVDFGISKSVTLILGQNKNTCERISSSIVSSALLVNSIFFLGIILFLTALYFGFGLHIFGSKISLMGVRESFVFMLAVFVLAIGLLNNLLLAVCESFYLVHYTNITFAFSSIGINASIYIASLFTNSLYILLYMPIFSLLFVLCLNVVVVAKFTHVRLVWPKKNWAKKLLSISYKFFNIGIINSLLIPANKYLLVYMTGSTALLGIFDVALKFALSANNLLQSIAQPLFGVFSNLAHKKDKVLKIVLYVSGLMFLMYILGVGVFYMIGSWLMQIIYASQAVLLYSATLTLIIGVGFNSLSEPCYRAMLGSGRLNEATMLKALFPILNILIWCSLSSMPMLKKFYLAYGGAMFFGSFVLMCYYFISYRKGASIC